MATVNYNTTRYQWFTLFAGTGCVLTNQPVDTQSATDMQMVADANRRSPDRTFVRPASIAEVTGIGTVYVDRCDAVMVDGEFQSLKNQGDCEITVNPKMTEAQVAEVWS